MDITVDELLQLQALDDVVEVDRTEASTDSGSFFIDDVDPGIENETNVMKRKCLTVAEKKQLLMDMFSMTKEDNILQRGIMKQLCSKYGVSRYVVTRIWRNALRQKNKGVDVIVESNRHKCGRKAKHITDETLKDVPLRKRTIIRSFASALTVSGSTVHRMIRRGIIRSHSNSIKPKLTEKHKAERLKFILGFVLPTTVHCKPRFDMLYNMVHIDEKWFFMTKQTQRFYLLSEEADPYRHCQSKGFITKVMFMGALARPWIGDSGEVLWDGKIGIFPFTEDVAARRGSVHRPRGTIETKPITHINKDIIRAMILEVVLPKIREKWPIGHCKTIWIQQDNARPHIQPTDPRFMEASKIDGFDIRIIQQPPQSPDLNVLNLGFFRAIQCLQHKSFPENVPMLIESVTNAYTLYNPLDINHTWLHLLLVMVEVLKVKEGNGYKNPHIGKDTLERQDRLPKCVEVEVELLNEVVNHLNSNIVLEATPLMDDSQNVDD